MPILRTVELAIPDNFLPQMEISRTKALISDVESFQNLLVSVATGGKYDEAAYSALRDKLIDESIITNYLPRFVHTCRDIGQFWQHIKKLFGTYRERREYLWAQFNPIMEFLEKGGTEPASIGATDTLQKIDSPHVVDAWKNAYNRRLNDPEGAITSARTLLEVVCKHILDEAGETYEESWDLPKLYKNAAEKLNLSPTQHEEQIFRQILGGCQTVVSSLGALRNKLGDAHGKGKAHVKPSTRHAALAVNLAGTVAAFLVNTLEERGIKY